MQLQIRKENGQVQIMNTDDSQFSLNKPVNMFSNARTAKGSDTLQQRLADIAHDINGPQATTNQLQHMVSKVSPLRDNVLDPQLISAMQHA